MCIYLFSCISLSEVIFIICYYIKANNTKYENSKINISDNLIKNLNIIMISLIIFNSVIIKVNILSPIELQIFYDRNKKIINSIYNVLYIYIFLSILFHSIFSLLKRISENKRNLKKITLE